MKSRNTTEESSNIRPSPTAFLLARVQLAHISPEMTDLMPLETCKLKQLPCEHIIELDRKFTNYLETLPYFLRADASSRARSKPLETLYPSISTMRYSILTAAHSRRCRLHQNFLLRLSSDRRYAYSRQRCLESARVVIDAFAKPQQRKDTLSLAKARMDMAVHHTHLAVVVLVMDLCFNKLEAEQDGIAAEVRAALRMLRDAAEVSQHAARSAESLRLMLQKHQVAIEPVATNNCVRGVSHRSAASYSAASYQAIAESDWSGLSGPKLSPDALTSYDETWDSEMDLNSADWDQFFASLDSRTL